jgi:NADH:ubiquinone oxidoreductase subunit 3 (subunit A)
MMQTSRLFLDFIPIVVWALLAIALVVVMLLASWVLRPHVLQNSEKTSTYECGEEPVGPARIAYPYNYFVYAILFVVVDVMGAFLWLLSSSNLLWADATKYVVVWQVVVFIFLVMGGIGFVMKMIPRSFLDGNETLDVYKKAKAERKQEQYPAGGH